MVKELDKKEKKKKRNEDKKIKFTRFNTVLSDDFKEMTINDFFCKLEAKLDKKDYSVIYDKEKNSFVIVYDGTSYQVDFDEQIMNQYALGIYTPLTRKLRNLNILEGLIEAPSLNDIKNDEERLVYLEYLKNSKKFSFIKVEKYFSNLKKDLKEAWNKLKNKYTDENGKSLLGKAFLIYAILMVGTFIILIIPALIWNTGIFKFCLAPFLEPLIDIIICIFFYAKKRFTRLSNAIRNKGLVDEKIKALEHPLNLTHCKVPSLQIINEAIDTKVNESEKFQNIILREINALVEYLNFINEEDRIVIANEIKGILNEYSQRISLINKMDYQVLDLDRDGLEKLRIELMDKIMDVRVKIKDILKKDRDRVSRSDEQKIVEDKLETILGQRKSSNVQTAYSRFISDLDDDKELVIPGDDIKKDTDKGYAFIKTSNTSRN